MIKVYIASPYTIGDTGENVKLQLDVFDELLTAGFIPFAPLWSHFQHIIHPRPYEDWVKFDNEWVLACNCVLRIGGESKGADGEVQLAKDYDIPIFYSVGELITYYL